MMFRLYVQNAANPRSWTRVRHSVIGACSRLLATHAAAVRTRWATSIVQPAYVASPRIISRIIALPKARAALSSGSAMRPVVSRSLPSAL
jgi:hypothetical protein